MWRALICLDTFWSSTCIEQQAFILHLFSTFMWATADYLYPHILEPAIVISDRELRKIMGEEFFSFPTHESRYFGRFSIPLKLQSNKIKALVLELQSSGLGTSEEIYRVLIPPLSQFDKLPNEAVADRYDAKLCEQLGNDRRVGAADAPDTCLILVNTVQERKVQDRFAKRAAVIVVDFLLQIRTFRHPIPSEIFLKKQKKRILDNNNNNNKTILKAILSQKPTFVRLGKLKENDDILVKLGLTDS